MYDKDPFILGLQSQMKQMLAHLQDLHRQHQRSYQRLLQHHYQNHLSCSYVLPHIPIILSYIHRLLTFQRRIFEKTRRLKKPRILSGLIRFSRLKLAFFKEVAFLPTLFDDEVMWALEGSDGALRGSAYVGGGS